MAADDTAMSIRARTALMYSSTKPAKAAHLGLIALTVLPLVVHVPSSVNVVLTASLAVYAGCWRSVKPLPPTEAMSKGEAMRFPLVGSAVLFSLFLLFKFLPAVYVNMLLAAYLGSIAVLVLTSAVTPYFRDLFPESLRDKEYIAPPFKIPGLLDATQDRLRATVPELFFGVFAAAFCLWYYVTKFWVANNVLGLVFCLEGIEHFSLGSVHVGTILLVGLFFYDIFWVFFTPVMVSVAKNFDAPIKLLFPRLGPLSALGKRPMAMLGLGDIVIPGIFVALMLRYDVNNGFRTKYFQSCFGGYVLGLVTTIVVMTYFNAAQPALLYIVPSILGSTFLHALLRGEFKQVFDFSEVEEEEAKEEGKEGADSKDATAAEGKKESKKSQ